MSISENIDQSNNNKIKQNKAQYDLDRKAAKISALSSRNVSKYEFLTGKYVSTGKELTENAATINLIEYSLLGKGIKEKVSSQRNNFKDSTKF